MGRTFKRHYEGRKLNAQEIKSAIKDLDFSCTKIVKMSLQNYNKEAYVVFEGRDGKRYLAVVLVYNKTDEIGTKCMSIDMMPCYHRCPLSLLKLIDDVEDENSLEWIAKCKEYNKWLSVYRKGLLRASELRKIHDNIQVALEVSAQHNF
jgi:hypothetical protein